MAVSLIVLLASLLVGSAAAAQSATGGAGAATGLPALDGPPAPVAPAVVNRDEAGRVTIRATRVASPLRIDGALDEELYRTVEPVSGLIQIEPLPGQPESERTEFWISFDGDNVYVAVRCFDGDMDNIVATEMRRDNGAILNGNDAIAFVFDTFYDRRNAYVFMMNPLGAWQDGQITNNRNLNLDFNPVWDVKAGRFEGGWTLEGAIPFKSLRYGSGSAQLWGFNLLRSRPGKNEIAFINRMPPARGRQALGQLSLAGAVVGIEAPPASRSLEIKPYATTSVTSDVAATPSVSNDPSAAAGIDVKYALTQGLTLDATYNTDFAQVEADEQQINLTRFSLFFPEKRDFFVENAGTFGFGGVSAGPGGGAAGGSGDVPSLFYSRRIGLNQGRLVPLDIGGRVTGRVGNYSIGLVNIQTGHEDVSRTRSTNFSVVRVKRDVLRNSAIGLIATGRSVGQAGTGTNQAFGADGTFIFHDSLAINTYWARTRTDALRGDDTSYRAQLDFNEDRYGAQLERLAVGDNFNPEVGFVRRDDMVRNYGQLRFSPRPRADRAIARRVRRFSSLATWSYTENGRGRLETREGSGELAVEFQNADRLHVAYNRLYEFLPRPFAIAQGVVLPSSGYAFDNVELGFNMGQQRRAAANLLIEHGSFYDGRRTAFSASRGRLQLHPQLSIEPSYSVNRVRLVEGSFTTHLAGSRITFTMTPRMFTSAFVQYNGGVNSVSANVRLRWEYRPGSELFVVYNDQRDTRERGFPQLTNRAFIIKINRLFRY